MTKLLSGDSYALHRCITVKTTTGCFNHMQLAPGIKTNHCLLSMSATRVTMYWWLKQPLFLQPGYPCTQWLKQLFFCSVYIDA